MKWNSLGTCFLTFDILTKTNNNTKRIVQISFEMECIYVIINYMLEFIHVIINYMLEFIHVIINYMLEFIHVIINYMLIKLLVKKSSASIRQLHKFIHSVSQRLVLSYLTSSFLCFSSSSYSRLSRMTAPKTFKKI